MTNDEIQEASRLIGEIETLEELSADKKTILSIARQTGDHWANYWPVSSIDPELARELVDLAIVRKKARLNDLRAGC